jgi:hypothetical protein
MGAANPILFHMNDCKRRNYVTELVNNIKSGISASTAMQPPDLRFFIWSSNDRSKDSSSSSVVEAVKLL